MLHESNHNQTLEGNISKDELLAAIKKGTLIPLCLVFVICKVVSWVSV
ncbi:hypothetical protein [Staphylococcus hyicus]|nr:hypothetical protein [Staphylococcus hyicus]SQE46558.1 Uncharacterised protein [Staphylococcus hyicus]